MIAFLFGVAWFPTAPGQSPGLLDPDVMLPLGAALVCAHIIVIADTLLVTGFYFYHLITNKRLREQKRLTWALLIVTSGLLVLPVYFYTEIWKDDRSPRHP
jgi:hypothetical protein